MYVVEVEVEVSYHDRTVPEARAAARISAKRLQLHSLGGSSISDIGKITGKDTYAASFTSYSIE